MAVTYFAYVVKLKITFIPFINKFLIVINSKLDIQNSGFGVASSFDSVFKYCGIWQFFCDTAVFCNVLFGSIALFRIAQYLSHLTHE